MEKCFKPTLREMKIKDDLTMETVYQEIQVYLNKNKKCDRNTTFKINQKYTIKIFPQLNYYISLVIDNDYFDLFIKPIKYKMITNENKIINLEIIAISQLNSILEKYNYNEPLIFCKQCNDRYYSLDSENLIIHENHIDSCIKESKFLTIKPKESYADFFSENDYFFGKNYLPLKFEPNFKLYFKDSDIIIKENKLKIFEDNNQTRITILHKIDIINSVDSLKKYFGQPGRGKTLSLIGILKYIINHEYKGTFYINCKTLSTLHETIELKQLIIDEIPFLFYNNHEDYLECAKIISNYNYLQKDNNSSFFILINLVIDYIIQNPKKKYYIIVFDQYNDKIDIDGKQLDKIYDKLIKHKDEKIKNIFFNIVTFSSMNNKDIRKYKIEYLKNVINKKDDKGNQILEIGKLDYNLSIDKGGLYDQNLERLGNGLKYYNMLRYYYIKQQTGYMFDLIETAKEKIENNLYDFFKIDKESISDDSSALNLLCSFSVDVEYSEDKVINIIDNIPFKYFDVVKNEKNDKFKITFAFPLVSEIFNEIYTHIINKNPHLYINITSNSNLDGGAKGKFFEKIVTYYLDIKSKRYSEKKQIDYFQDYPIQYHIEIDTLVLNRNEKFEKVSFDKNLQKGIYLLTQRRYNGKAFDIAILKVSEINEMIAAQISIRKKYIFTNDEISEYLLNLKANVQNYFGLKVNNSNLYFCYIFEKNNTAMTMIDKCDINGLKYLFFDVINESFVNKYGNNINTLKPHLLNFSSLNSTITNKNINSYHKIEEFFTPKVRTRNISNNEQNDIKENKYFNGPYIEINKNQKDSIQKFYANDLGLKYLPEIEYQYSIDMFKNKYREDRYRFSISNYRGDNENENKKSVVLYPSSYSKLYYIQENGGMLPYSGYYSDIYDYYAVVKKI